MKNICVPNKSDECLTIRQKLGRINRAQVLNKT